MQYLFPSHSSITFSVLACGTLCSPHIQIYYLRGSVLESLLLRYAPSGQSFRFNSQCQPNGFLSSGSAQLSFCFGKTLGGGGISQYMCSLYCSPIYDLNPPLLQDRAVRNRSSLKSEPRSMKKSWKPGFHFPDLLYTYFWRGRCAKKLHSDSQLSSSSFQGTVLQSRQKFWLQFQGSSGPI